MLVVVTSSSFSFLNTLLNIDTTSKYILAHILRGSSRQSRRKLYLGQVNHKKSNKSKHLGICIEIFNVRTEII